MKFVKKWKYTLTSVTLVLVVMILILVMLHQRSKCVDQGGDYVQGLFWFECVGGKE